MSQWGSDVDANKLKKSYIKGFLDISGGNVIAQNSSTIMVMSAVANVPALQMKTDRFSVYTGTSTVDVSYSTFAALNVLGVSYEQSTAELIARTKYLSSATGPNITLIGNNLVSSDLQVYGNISTYTTGALSLLGDASLNKNASVTGNFSTGGNTTLNGNTTLGSRLLVSGDASFNGNLDIGTGNNSVAINKDISAGYAFDVSGTTIFRGDTYLTSRLLLSSDVSLNGRLFVNSDLSMNGNIQVGGNAIVGNSAIIIGDASLNRRLFVNGDVSFNSRLFVNSDLSLNGNTSVRGNSTIGNNMIVSGDASLNSRLYVNGDVSLNSRLFVRSDLSLNGNIVVGGNTIVNRDASLNSRLFVNGDVSFNSRLFVNSDLSLNGNTTVRGNSIIGTNIVVSGDASLNSRLFVNGDVSLNGRLFIRSDVSLNGNSVVGGNTIVNGDASLNGRLYLNGDASLNNRLFVRGDLSLNGNTVIGGNTTLGNNITVGGDASFNRQLFVGGDASFNGRLFVNNDMSLNGNLVIGGNTTIGNNVSFNGDVSLNRRLYVGGDVSLNSRLFVNNDASFNNNVVVGGNTIIGNRLVVARDASFNGNLDIGTGSQLVAINKDVSAGFHLDISGNLRASGNALFNSGIFINETIGTRIPTANASTGTITLTHLDASGASSILFKSTNNAPSDYAYIQYEENVGGSNENGLLTIGIENDASNRDRISLYSAGGNGAIGVNTKDPVYSLDISGNLRATSDVFANSRLFVSGDASLNANLAVNTIQPLSSSATLNIATTQTSGQINIGTGAGRTTGSTINIGTATDSSSNIFIGNATNQNKIGMFTASGEYFSASANWVYFTNSNSSGNMVIGQGMGTGGGWLFPDTSSGQVRIANGIRTNNGTSGSGSLQIATNSATGSTGAVSEASGCYINFGTGTRTNFSTINIGTGTNTNNSSINIGTGTRDATSAINIGTGTNNSSDVNILTGTNATGELVVGGDVSFNKKLIVNGDVSLNGRISFNGVPGIIANSDNSQPMSYATNTTVGTVNVAVDQTSGTLNIGTGTLRTGAVNIGTGSNNTTVTIGNANNINTIGQYTVSGQLIRGTGNVFFSGSAAGTSRFADVTTTGSVDIATAQSSGTLSIGALSGRTGVINIGTGSATGNINIGGSVSGPGGQYTIKLGNGAGYGPDITANQWKFYGSNTELEYFGTNPCIIDISNDVAVNLFNTATTKDLNIGTGTGRTGNINIGTGQSGTTGKVNILTSSASGGLNVYGGTGIWSTSAFLTLNSSGSYSLHIGNNNRTYTNPGAKGDINIGTGTATGSADAVSEVSGCLLNIGTGTRTRYSSINIGTGSRDVGSAINIGTGADVSGAINIGTGAQNYGDVNILTGANATGKLVVGGDVSLNSKLALNGDLSLNGKITFNGVPGIIANSDGGLAMTYASGTTAGDVNVATDQIGGTLNIGTAGSRTGAINIGTGTASSNNVNILAGTGKLIVGSDASFNTNIAVNGDASLNSRLFVRSDISSNGNIVVGGNTVIGTNAIVSGDASFNSRLYVGGDVSLNSRLFVSSDMSLNGNIVIGGNSIVNRDASLNSRLYVGGDVSFNSRLFVRSDMSLNGNIVIGGNSIVNRDASFNSRMFVGGDVSFNSRLFVRSDMSLNGNIVIGGNTIVNRDASFNSRMFVGGDVSFNSRIFVRSDISLNGNIVIGGNSVINGDASFNSRLFVGGDVSFNSRLFVRSDMSLNGNIVIGGNSVVNGDVSFNNRLYVGGDVSFNSRLFVRSDLSLNGNIVTGGSTIVGNGLIVSGDASLNGNLRVQRSIAINKDISSQYVLDVNGISQFRGNVDVGGSFTINGVAVNAGNNLSGNVQVGTNNGYVTVDKPQFYTDPSLFIYYNFDTSYNNGARIYNSGFGGSTYDASLNANPGTSTTLGVIDTTLFKYGGASLKNDPNTPNNHGTYTYNVPISTKMSISFWINKKSIPLSPDWDRVFEFTSNTGFNQNENNTIALDISSNGYIYPIITNGASNILSSVQLTPFTNYNICDNSWNLVTWTLNDLSSNIYINGAIVQTNSLTQAIPDGSRNQLLVAYYTAGVNKDFSGNIDDFRYYKDKVLTQAEIFQLRNNYYYNLDVCGGIVANGSSLIYEANGSKATANSGSLVLMHGDASGSSSIMFKSNNDALEYGYIQYDENAPGSTGYHYGLMTIGIENDAGSGSYTAQADRVSLFPSGGQGYVGVNTKTPQFSLDISGQLRVYEGAGTSASVNTGSIVLEHTAVGGTSSLVFKGPNSVTSDYAYMQYTDASNAMQSLLKYDLSTNNPPFPLTGLATIPSTGTLTTALTARPTDNSLNWANSIDGSLNGFVPLYCASFNQTNINAGATSRINYLDASGTINYSSSFSTSLWIYPSDMSFNQTTSGKYHIVNLALNNPTYTGVLELYIEHRAGGTGNLVAQLNSDSNYYQYYNIGIANQRKWYHVAFSFNSYTQTGQLYVNGSTTSVLEASATLINYSGKVINSFNTLTLGAAWQNYTGQNNNRGFRGQMAFVNMFDRPLSASDVAYLYTNPSYNVTLNPERGLLTIGVENDTGTINNDRIVLWPGAGTGSVGINNRTPVATLDVSGSINASGLIQGQRFNSTSDYRVKSDIKDLDASYTVDTLRPVTYKFVSNGLSDIGFVAHEVQSQYPFLVQGEKDGPITQSLNYNGIIGILTKELKELKAVVRELKDTVSIQSSKLLSLNDTVSIQSSKLSSLNDTVSIQSSKLSSLNDTVLEQSSKLLEQDALIQSLLIKNS